MCEDADYLVTGSSGTIGTALGEYLIDKGTRLRGVDCRPNTWSHDIDERTIQLDLLRLDSDSPLPKPDTIIHLAAHSRVQELVDDPMLAQENIAMTANVLEFARNTDANLVFASSREVYGQQTQTIYSETDINPNSLVNAYGASKLAGEALVTAYGSCYDIDVSILRLPNVYGKYDASDRVVPVFIQRALNGNELKIYGEEKVLDFLYIDDCVRAIAKAAAPSSACFGEALNVGSGVGHTLIELADLIRSRVDSQLEIRVETNRQGEPSRYIADTDRMRRLVGFEAEYDLHDGLDKTLNWYQSRPDVLTEIS